MLIFCLVVFAICAFWFFKKEDNQAGNLIEESDPNAPKVITSKDIQSFYIYAHHFGFQDIKEDSLFEYEIIKEEAIILKDLALKTEEEIDISILEELQTLIDKHELALKNGTVSYRVGLAPAYQKLEVRVLYESGEVLSFKENNDPRADWTFEIIALLTKKNDNE